MGDNAYLLGLRQRFISCHVWNCLEPQKSLLIYWFHFQPADVTTLLLRQAMGAALREDMAHN